MTTRSPATSFAALAVIFLLCCTLGRAHAEQPDIKIATAYAADNFQTKNLQQFANDVSVATKGAVTLKIFSAGSLLAPKDIFSGTRTGKADGGEVMMSSLAKEDAIFGMDALPFIVSSYDDARHMWDASRGTVAKALDARGLQLLYAVPWPPQNVYTNRPMTTTQDFRGQRLRTYNPATERIADLLGAKPVRIEVVDLARSIADDKFDLMFTSSWTGVETKAWSKMRYYYRAGAWFPKNVVFINKQVFEALQPAQKKALLEQASVAETRGWKMSQDSDAGYETQLAANNVTVSNIDPFIRHGLDRLGETLAREWLKQAGRDEWQVLLKYTTERSQK